MLKKCLLVLVLSSQVGTPQNRSDSVFLTPKHKLLNCACLDFSFNSVNLYQWSMIQRYGKIKPVPWCVDLLAYWKSYHKRQQSNCSIYLIFSLACFKMLFFSAGNVQYLSLQGSLYEFGVFLCRAVTMTQFAIVSITPAEHLPFTCECQCEIGRAHV